MKQPIDKTEALLGFIGFCFGISLLCIGASILIEALK